MKIIKYLVLSFVVLGLLSLNIAFAGNRPDPMVMMRSVSDQMLAALKRERPNLKRQPNLIFNLVEKIVIPHVDLYGMSRSVLGRDAWGKATVAQRKSFSKEFMRVIVKTYASALNAYSDETIKFYPLRVSYQKRRRIQVESEVIRPDGPSIPVSYRLAYLNTHSQYAWKIYDLNVEGVSLLQSFHAQFTSSLSQGKTVNDLIKDLKARK